jgi:hypothetical protein
MSDLDPLFDQLVHAMNHGPWTDRQSRGGVVVASGHPAFTPGGPPYPCEGFRITAERDDITLEHALAYFHDACHFADTANEMTTKSQIIRVDGARVDRYRAVVRWQDDGGLMIFVCRRSEVRVQWAGHGATTTLSGWGGVQVGGTWRLPDGRPLVMLRHRGITFESGYAEDVSLQLAPEVQ